jgi:diguanylate cyclase (GGDEF)-like protein
MADITIDIKAQLEQLRLQFIDHLRHGLDELEAMVAASPSRPRQEQLEDLHHRLHRITGSSGTFGLPGLSTQARHLETQVKVWLNEPELCSLADWQHWSGQVMALRGTLNAALAEPAAASETPATPAEPVKPAPAKAPGGEKKTRIHILEDDGELGGSIALGLRYFGYEAHHFTEPAALLANLDAQPPEAIICDVMLGQGNPTGPEFMRREMQDRHLAIPLLFISSRDDFASRLAAAQSGAIAYLVKPLDIPRLVDRLDQALRQHEQTPYRILIVDDDIDLASHFRLALTGAGMQAEALANPEQVLEATQRLQPDLILMDISMPPYSGVDLARTLRLQDEWLSIPIVYLSAEDDLDAQMRAMESGADEFLTKPIASHHLVAAVRGRASRARQLSELMARDSLTGLLNHARIKEQLVIEAARAMRSGSNLSVAMIDMDHFKAVNDTHGHAMGDRVIKTLAQFLRQQMRQQDSVGRYGGEEFVVILPDCSAADAEAKFNDIRERFKQIQFGSEGQAFSVTLSAGIASIGHLLDSHDLLVAADSALYAAKRGGRDRVCVAGGCKNQPTFA